MTTPKKNTKDRGKRSKHGISSTNQSFTAGKKYTNGNEHVAKKKIAEGDSKIPTSSLKAQKESKTHANLLMQKAA